MSQARTIRLTAAQCADCGSADWRAVIDFEGRYEVSRAGQVRSLSVRKRWHTGHVMTTRTNHSGYPVITLRDASGKTHLRPVHRLVAEAFLGPRPTGKQVAHNDGVRQHACAINLRYATPRENQADRIRHGTVPLGRRNGIYTHPHRRPRGERNGQSKLTWQQVAEMRREHASGATQRALARRYTVSQAAVWSIVRHKTWVHRAS